MIKLKDIEVKNFKSLIDTKIELFGAVNMFYGFNNSGKSNVFKFLELLFMKKRRGTKVRVNTETDNNIPKTQNNFLVETTNFWEGYIWGEPFLFTNNIRTEKIQFKVSLDIDNASLPNNEELNKAEFLKEDEAILTLIGQILSVDIETSELKLTAALINGRVFYRNQDQIEEFFPELKSDIIDEKVGRSILELLNDLVLFVDTDRNFTKENLKDGITTLSVQNFKNALYELYINAEKNARFDELIKFLGSFEFSEEAKTKLIFNLKSFPFKANSQLGFTKFDNELEIMLNNNEGRLPLKNFGTGIQQFLYILTRIFNSKSRIVIIEELELNLSPLYQKELLRFLKLLIPRQFDQMIFSSHSPFFAEKDANMIDVIHHVQIGVVHDGCTLVECHDDIPSINDTESGTFYFTLLYS